MPTPKKPKKTKKKPKKTKPIYQFWSSDWFFWVFFLFFLVLFLFFWFFWEGILTLKSNAKKNQKIPKKKQKKPVSNFECRPKLKQKKPKKTKKTQKNQKKPVSNFEFWPKPMPKNQKKNQKKTKKKQKKPMPIWKFKKNQKKNQKNQCQFADFGVATVFFWFFWVSTPQNYLYYELWFSVCLFVRYGPYLVRNENLVRNEKRAHVHLASWKHGNGEVKLNMVCTQ